ncbi:bumetanide-sensitive sodium-(potassium)-chloride cotransporter isoform X1 [Frankliniella occidentalis]|uniref:Bumetanide-sensitive sodium-(Potassium)-chloride cotransporter isoform X1 n=1 Tax=Frankliniella occidentalis TaxID=133901 RepID=A0A6J1T3D4_FRAOC|nr:bumetanide-sensitive sodium-(potassium)-chloride cotransporter isoform X1 [Frankliniella occidentalis]
MDQDDGRPTSDANTYAYAKSFRQLTREALPRLDNYRNIMSIQAAYRPTLDELHNATLTAKQSAGATLKGAVPPTAGEGVVKFGWIVGVLIRCLLNIWGVMLFLRLTWVVGEAGVAQGVLLILSASVVTIITAMSMSAISTNGEIKGGGTYYMISRSLGPEFGGSIGLIFSLANAIACAMYVVGFCESLRDLLKSLDTFIVDGGTQDVRIVGSITMLLLTGVVVIGMEWEAKAQFVLLIILLLAIGDFFIGSLIGPTTDEDKARGFVGFSAETFANNVGPDYRYQKGEQHNFFSVFAIFFPAATGILAGANISGDLKDPQTAIPKGTILSIIVTSITYILMAIVAGAVVVRDASGNVTDLLNNTFTDCANRTCDYGLQNNFQVVEMVSAFGPLIYAGCFAATLSSALASLVSAPKVFQALCKDRLYPYIFWFSKGYGKNQEPVRGYVLTFFIAIAFILIGELDAIAPLISNFFLAAYALINFSTFHASLAKPVGWRPTFKFYNMWLSLVGSILCVAVMFLISWSTALITFGIVLALYLIVQYRKPDVNWGSTTQAQTYKNALNSVQQLNYVEDHVKNYRPQILILSGIPNYRPPLIDFAFLMTKNLSLLICGHIIKSSVPQRVRNALSYKAHSWLKAHKIRAFYSQVDDSSFEEGAKTLIQASGVGKLRPNILLMGFKNDWRTCDSEDLLMYFNTMHKALDLHMGVAVLRVEGGFDYSKILSGGEEPRQNGNIPQVPSSVGMGTNGNLNRTRQNSQESLSIPHNQSFSQLSTGLWFLGMASSVSDLSTPPTPNLNKSRVSDSPNADDTDQNTTPEHDDRSKKERKKQESRADLYKGAGQGDTDLPKDVLNSITRFQRKQKKGTIDVWWLYDDGGLTLLLPHIITTRGNWSDCKLRVFTLANKQAELEYEQRSMASLLAKFRIDYSALKLIPDITKKPKDSTMSFFEDLISPFIVPESDEENETTNGITEADLLAMKDKTNRHLRLRELVLEHSSDANLVVMTLPMPRKNIVSASLYMAWLEVLTRDMPPFLLVRGNQTSVLTFYS